MIVQFGPWRPVTSLRGETKGEKQGAKGGILRKSDVQTARLESTVETVTPERVRLRLVGFVHIGSAFDPAKATTPNGPLEFGYQTRLHGVVEFDRQKKIITRFDVVAPGEVWGRSGDANGKSPFAEWPRSTPFGFAFELALGDSPTERIPPGGNSAQVSEQSGYFPKP